MAQAFDLIRRLLYPQGGTCIACGRIRVDAEAWGLCEKCARAVVLPEGPFCPRCGQQGWAMECPDCMALSPDVLDGMSAPFAYEGTVRKLVQVLKYSGVQQAARPLAEGMARMAADMAPDVLVPVPLHKRRKRQRGFNQAAVLAAAVGHLAALPMVDALARTRATKSQTRFSAEGRTKNVQGAFAAVGPLDGLRVVLVDDVLTTGATARACAEVLKAAGAREVKLLVAARAERR